MRLLLLLFVLLAFTGLGLAANPMSFQSYLNGKTEATTVAPGTDYIPIMQGSMVRKTHPNALFSQWQTRAFSSSDYASNQGTWTVYSYNVATLAYLLQGKTMTISWYIRDTSVSGSPTSLFIHIPENKISNRLVYGVCGAINNGINSTCVAQLQTTSPNIILYVVPTATLAWPNSTGSTSVFGQITFEVQ